MSDVDAIERGRRVLGFARELADQAGDNVGTVITFAVIFAVVDAVGPDPSPERLERGVHMVQGLVADGVELVAQIERLRLGSRQ